MSHVLLDSLDFTWLETWDKLFSRNQKTKMRRLTCWSSSEEWKQVYNFLYSDEITLQKIGVNRVKCWASRGKLPHAVEATSNLLEVQLQDSLGTMSTLSDRELCNLYSIYLIRFVNGFVDAAQKGNYSASASTIAEQLNLPLWFVEIRHQATHEKIPNLPYLRKCANQALIWLRDRYWEVQTHALEDTRLFVLGCLDEYLLAVDQQQASGPSNRHKVLENLTSGLSRDAYPDILFPILLEKIEHDGLSPEAFHFRFFVSKCSIAWTDLKESLLSMLIEEAISKDSANINHWLHFAIESYANTLKPDFILEAITKCLQQENRVGYDAAIAFQTATKLPEQGSKLDLVVVYLRELLLVFENSESVISPKGEDLDHESVEKTINELEENLSKILNRQQELPAFSAEPNLQEKRGLWALAIDWTPCPIGCLPGSSIIPNLDVQDPIKFDNLGWLQSQQILQIPMPQLNSEINAMDANKKEEEIVTLF